MDHFISVKSMLEYVENRLNDELDSAEVASAAQFSHSHFRAVFKELTGMSLARYIGLRRLSHAAFELVHSQKSVADIAMKYYFNSHDAFSRAFKREFGETPSQFRKSKHRVGGTLIVPGVFGPKVQLEEENMMNSTEFENDCILHGVPKVSYIESFEITPFIASLKSCLNYMGQNMGYAKLMAVSGAAFRFIWNTEYWDGGNVDILGMRPDPLEPVKRAFQAAGRDFQLLLKKDSFLMQIFEQATFADISREMSDCGTCSRPEKFSGFSGTSGSKSGSTVEAGEREDFLSLIQREIKVGKPLIAFGIIGPPEACIITGYRNDGEMLTGWNFFQHMPEFAGNISYEPCGYYRKIDWYEHPGTMGVMAIGAQNCEPEDRMILKETLQYALEIMQTDKVHNRAAGFRALEAWKNALMNPAEFPKDAPLPLLMERLMCQMDATTMVGEGRWYAAEYLHSQKDCYPEIAVELETAANLFKEESGIVHGMANVLGGFGMGEKEARNLGIPEKRAELVRMITEVIAKERLAVVALERAVGEL